MLRHDHLNKYISCSEPTLSFDDLHVRVKLENYDKELEADIYPYLFDSLKYSRKLTDKILPFCTNINEIWLSSDAKFQICMRYISVSCCIDIRDYIEFMQYDENGLCEPEYFNIDQFDEFLEMFSKTPFYKRPEFIKVAIKD